MTRRCPPRGFNLIELVMVVAILGVLAGLALPRYADAHARYRVAAAARRVQADLTLARHAASAASADRSLAFNVANQSYTLTDFQDPDHPSRSYTVELAGGDVYGTLVSASFGDDATIHYDGFGQPSSGGTVVVRVGAFDLTVTVDAQSGQAAVSDRLTFAPAVLPVKVTPVPTP